MKQFSMGMEEDITLLTVLKKIFLENGFLLIRGIMLFSLFSGLVGLFYKSYVFSCQMSILQNILLPFADTKLILRALQFQNDKKHTILGLQLGSFVGSISAFITLLINNLQYYFGGEREAAFLLRQQPVPHLTFELLWAGLGSQVFLWLFLIMLSAIAGLMATINLRRR